MYRVLLIIASLVMGIIFGYMVATEPKAVCHATTEDSVITDCDYRNGAWWTK